MFTKIISLFFVLCWVARDQSPGSGQEAGCHYYYNQSLKKNVYTIVETEPEFPGREAAYVQFLNKNLWITGDTMNDVTSLPIPGIKFIVDTDGQIFNPGIQGKNDTTHLNSLENPPYNL